MNNTANRMINTPAEAKASIRKADLIYFHH